MVLFIAQESCGEQSDIEKKSSDVVLLVNAGSWLHNVQDGVKQTQILLFYIPSSMQHRFNVDQARKIGCKIERQL